jgi:phage terminase small subunit
MPELENNRHEIFCLLCAGGMVETHAYAKVFNKDPEKGSTRGSASALRSKPIIAARIKELQQTIAVKVVDAEVISRTDVLKILKNIATFDLAECYDEQGNLKNIHDIPAETRQAMAGIKVFEEFEGFGRERTKVGETREVKAWDKNKAAENLGRFHKLFTDKVEHSGTVNLAERLKRARERTKP